MDQHEIAAYNRLNDEQRFRYADIASACITINRLRNGYLTPDEVDFAALDRDLENVRQFILGGSEQPS